MDEKRTLKIDIQFNQPITAFTLSIGGWLPVAFTQSRHVLVDRNIIGILRQIGCKPDTSDLVANKWWFSFLDSASYILNPLLCAMEGDAQKTPSFDNFVYEFDSSYRLLKEKLPNAKIVKYQKENYVGAYQIVEKLIARSTREINFLINTAPIVAERPSNRIINRIEDNIFLNAEKYTLSNYSLVVLAVLSCLYDDKRGATRSIGKRIVKPMKNYDGRKAYNVISDLRCLEALIAMNVLSNVSFITRDKALAAFWCAINPTNQKFMGNSISYDVDINTKLLPRLGQDGIERLIKRMGSNVL